MKSLILYVSLSTVLFCMGSNAHAKQDKYHKQYGKCYEAITKATGNGLNDCDTGTAEIAETDIKKYADAILNKLNTQSDAANLLVRAQSAFFGYRDLDCKTDPFENQCLMEKNIQRALELNERLNNLQ